MKGGGVTLILRDRQTFSDATGRLPKLAVVCFITVILVVLFVVVVVSQTRASWLLGGC